MTRLVTTVLALALLGTGCDTATPVIESTTRLQPTTDEVGPYLVESVIIGAEDDLVQLYYVIGEEDHYLPVRMEPDGERFSAAIPGQPRGTVISYFVAVVRGDVRVVSDPEAGGAAPYQFYVIE